MSVNEKSETSGTGQPETADPAVPKNGITPEIEARFLEQDHRSVRIWHNWWLSRSLPAGDPRKSAALKAIFWWFFSPGKAAIAGAGLTAVASIVILFWQTKLIREQNDYFRDQNEKLQQQLEIQIGQEIHHRRNLALSLLYKGGDSGDLAAGPVPPKLKEEALLEFLSLEAELRKPNYYNKHIRGSYDLIEGDHDKYSIRASLEDAQLSGIKISNRGLYSINFRNVKLRGASFTRVSFTRSQFVGADCEGISFYGCDLRFVFLSKCLFRGGTFGSCGLSFSDFTEADLEGVEFLNCELCDANLQDVKNWQKIKSIKGTNIFGARNMPQGFKEWALSNGAVENEKLRWTLSGELQESW